MTNNGAMISIYPLHCPEPAILQTKGLLPIPKNPKATTVTTTTAEPTTEPISPSHNNTTSSDGAIVVAKPPGAD